VAEKTAALVVEDIHKRFGDLEVLKGVSLTANEHDVISIIGSSGSGKSTFLRCINLLEIPDSGRVEVAGEEIQMRVCRRTLGGRTAQAGRPHPLRVAWSSKLNLCPT
jgi:octopine/nopaline transport system ATP-binding protein